jgi:hypothetical protein
MDTKLLGIYLNDHLAGARAGLELAHRTERENRHNTVGDYLASLIAELEQDRDTLLQVMQALGVSRSAVKQGAALVGERLGRLKLNGRLLRYSPLSRVEELEALCLGGEGRLGLWRTLRRLARTEARLRAFDFDAHIARVEAQHMALERLRLQAVDTAFSEPPVSPRPTPAPVGEG